MAAGRHQAIGHVAVVAVVVAVGACSEPLDSSPNSPGTLSGTTVTTVAPEVIDFAGSFSDICAPAQQEVYRLQRGFTQVPTSFPAPDWSEFYDAQAELGRDTLEAFREIAPSAPDPDVFNAALDDWEANQVQRQADWAVAARLDDDGEAFREIVDRQMPDDSLRAYGIALADIVDPSSTVLQCVGVFFGPDQGN